MNYHFRKLRRGRLNRFPSVPSSLAPLSRLCHAGVTASAGGRAQRQLPDRLLVEGTRMHAGVVNDTRREVAPHERAVLLCRGRLAKLDPDGLVSRLALTRRDESGPERRHRLFYRAKKESAILHPGGALSWLAYTHCRRGGSIASRTRT
eukprot:scaffold4097_cov306-Pinguiococcus_pyrenoidosus.AAC.26